MRQSLILLGAAVTVLLLTIIWFLAYRSFRSVNLDRSDASSSTFANSTGSSSIERIEFRYGDPFTGENTPKEHSTIIIYFKTNK